MSSFKKATLHCLTSEVATVRKACQFGLDRTKPVTDTLCYAVTHNDKSE